MKSIYYQGLQSPRNTYWMGDRKPDQLGQPDWLPGLLQTGGTAFSQYESAQAAEDAKKAADAQRAAAAANAQTAATNAATQNAIINSKKIMGLDPGVFWVGAAAVGALGVAAVVMASKKK